ncbi:hypothetical protein [Noviherbaspirillum galbum]|uniref:M50 family peptidase n=1 Tax=Noviherbaspirillum galbum TaxID=2709383 RepID=A0A6B3SYV2_9BURK|nr:hypothetical protein [Noviherbaspirillum galbum]NEX64062.1 hypothetical protein [Noviherbaspirillum galbum]
MLDTTRHLAPTLAHAALAHADLLLYLLPSALLAALLHALSRRHAFFLAWLLPGTFMHEMAHLLAAAVTNARPVSFSILPRRQGNAWILGTVGCANIRWYNGLFVGLAPMLVLALPVGVAVWRTRHGVAWEWDDAWIAALLAPQLVSWLPSSADWRLALHSWPISLAAAILLGMFFWMGGHA